jgi:hypothetical protein
MGFGFSADGHFNAWLPQPRFRVLLVQQQQQQTPLGIG